MSHITLCDQGLHCLDKSIGTLMALLKGKDKCANYLVSQANVRKDVNNLLNLTDCG